MGKVHPTAPLPTYLWKPQEAEGRCRRYLVLQTEYVTTIYGEEKEIKRRSFLMLADYILVLKHHVKQINEK